MKWQDYADTRAKVHYEAAHYYGGCSWNLGLPTVFLASIVSTGIFATLKDVNPKDGGQFHGLDGLRLIVACLSVIAAALTGLQNFAKFAERGEKHKGIASRYGAIHREIEAVIALPVESRPDAHKFLDAVRAKLDGCETDALDVSRRIWLSTQKKSSEASLRPSLSSDV